jgi:hypothetical protein
MDTELEKLLKGEELDGFVSQGLLRVVALVLMYFLSLMVFGIPLWKAAVVTFVIWIVMKFGFARRHLERLAVLLFGIVVVQWSGLLPLDAWARGLIAITTRTLV